MDKTQRIERVAEVLLAMQRSSWEQGVAAQAFLELGDMRRVVLMAREAMLRQNEDGRLGCMYGGNGVTDPAACGEPVLAAAGETGDTELAAAAARMADWLLRRAPRTPSGVICHIMEANQVWVDSMYMSPPFLAAAGYPEEAVRQIEGMKRILYDADRHLYSHMWDEDKQTFARRDFWGVGNGWAAAGITRVIRALPESMTAEKQALIGHLRELLDGCLSHMRPDGLFHDVVDRPETFVETNLAQMLSYAIYRGVKAGYLGGEYLKQADKMREAVDAKVDDEGFVNGVCGAPHFDRPGRAPEGQAFYLLMEAAAADIA